MTQNPFSAAPTAPADADQLTSRSRRHRQNPNFSNLLGSPWARLEITATLGKLTSDDLWGLTVLLPGAGERGDTQVGQRGARPIERRPAGSLPGSSFASVQGRRPARTKTGLPGAPERCAFLVVASE